MRIISGKYKGKRILAPRELPVRPTTDMAKEALFNILNNSYYFEDLKVLDLFSGTGNIAYEFASRGCRQIYSVDQDYRCIKFISKTSKTLDLNIQTIKSDVFKYLKKTDLKFDIIFADPPYRFELNDFANIPELVFSRDLLLPDGTLIIEHSKHTELSELQHFKTARKYGGSVFSFFET
ncbi:16S rRNA (guanine(966)-N(2))-methyltransferase RsmD [Poritiphilus flavus]|uniref:16S rRNA (Guanine(966)-N(2))-methyltransferase RsmD n=1 Tax=Poritiphilus flavus TaxID=2697053 RepID=A0A6L9ECH6_9FLAO|nr:16S rRNA (guanine(966)-N(2))-methyltransferase RsmD [Poritiphilus flavus]NAS12099.1 16S rRNA (guanine(966)-N(2))-methyltransferase RsmD [Poritiphilus flavus]